MSRFSAIYADKPVDPVQYTYNAHMRGYDVSSIKLAGMVKTFLTFRELHIISQMCDKIGYVAVASRRLTKRQRLKYTDNRIEAGRAVYYLFPRILPADVGAQIQIEDGVTVYQ